MGKIALVSARNGASVAAGSTNTGIFGNANANNTNDDNTRTIHTSGVASGLLVVVLSNDRASTSFALRINGADGNQVLTIPASTTGTFEDTSNTDTITAGDEVNYRFVVGTGGSTFVIPIVSCHFAASSNTVTKVGVGDHDPISTASTQAFYPIGGRIAIHNTTEASALVNVKTAGTFRDLSIGVNTNARTTTTTVGVRHNGADSALVIAVSASTTGTFENTTDTVTVAVDDTTCLFITTGTGTGNFRTVRGILFEFETTNNKWQTFSGQSDANGFVLSASATHYTAIGGALEDDFTAEANAQHKLGIACRLSMMQVRVISNTVSAASAVTLRKNGSDSAVSVSITASTTGLFQDTSNSESIDVDDLVNYAFVMGGSGTSVGISAASILGHLTQEIAAGQASETDTGLALTARKIVTVGIASETDTAFSVTRVGAPVAVGQASETDTGLALTARKTIVVGIASESDTGLALTAAKNLAVGIASETDTAFAVTRGGVLVNVGLASETDTAFAVTVAKRLAVGLASEIDTAFPVTRGGVATLVGIASETDSALPLTVGKKIIVGIATETDEGLAVTVLQVSPTGPYIDGLREFQVDFESPVTVVQTRTSTTIRPDAITFDRLIAFATGPKDLADVSEGAASRAWYVRHASNTVFIARANDTNTAWEPETILFTYSGPEITELDFSFEQAARAVVVAERPTGTAGAPEVWIYWYDPTALPPDFVFQSFGSGRTPVTVLDDPQDTTNSDVQVMYLLPGSTAMRLEQRDRYQIQYPMPLVEDSRYYFEELIRTRGRRLAVIYSFHDPNRGRYHLGRLESHLYPSYPDDTMGSSLSLISAELITTFILYTTYDKDTLGSSLDLVSGTLTDTVIVYTVYDKDTLGSSLDLVSSTLIDTVIAITVYDKDTLGSSLDLVSSTLVVVALVFTVYDKDTFGSTLDLVSGTLEPA